MKGNATLENEVLKASALLYFREALVKQEYETCAELAAAARELDAQQGEISEVIAAYLQKPVNRLRALTKE